MTNRSTLVADPFAASHPRFRSGEREPFELPESFGPYANLRTIRSTHDQLLVAADDLLSNHAVLLQIFHGERASLRARDRFLRDARLSAAIFHQHLPRVLEVGELNGCFFLAAEFPSGEWLEGRLLRESRWSMREALRIGQGIAEALAEAHRHGLVHGDVSPRTIRIEAENRIRLMAFALGAAEGSESLLDRWESHTGTPGYLSPEQASGEPLSPSSDLFSLGCVLYRLLTGETPFRGTTLPEAIRTVVADSPRPLREVVPELPTKPVECITRMLAKNAEDRPPSAREVADCFGDYLEPGKRRATGTRVVPPERIVIDPPVKVRPSVPPRLSEVPTESRRHLQGESEAPPKPSDHGATAASPSTEVPPKGELIIHPPKLPWVEEPAAPKAKPAPMSWVEHAVAALLVTAAAIGLYHWWKASRPQPATSPPAAISTQVQDR